MWKWKYNCYNEQEIILACRCVTRFSLPRTNTWFCVINTLITNLLIFYQFSLVWLNSLLISRSNSSGGKNFILLRNSVYWNVVKYKEIGKMSSWNANRWLFKMIVIGITLLLFLATKVTPYKINQNLSFYSFNLNVWMDNYLCVSYSMVFNGLNSKQYITYSENANVILLILLFASLIIDTQDIRFQWKILHYQIFVDLSISMPVLTNITLCVVVLQIDWFVSNETMKLFMIVSNCLVKINVSSQMITISRYLTLNKLIAIY